MMLHIGCIVKINFQALDKQISDYDILINAVNVLCTFRLTILSSMHSSDSFVPPIMSHTIELGY